MTGREISMVREKSSMRVSQDELLVRAAAILRTRYKYGGSCPGLSPTAAAELSSTLEATSTAADPPEGIDRDEAIALAHRLVADDQPELSPMWPRPSS